MNKTWLILKHEYLRHVKRKRFIFSLLSVPFFVLVMVGVGFLSAFFSINDAPIGYIDQSGIFANPAMPEFERPMIFKDPMQIINYTAETEANQALDNEAIQAYFIIDENYMENAQIHAVANEAVDSDARRAMRQFPYLNLLNAVPENISTRLMEGGDLEVRALDGGRETNADNVFNFILPFVAGFMFMLAINMTGGYLLQAVVEEKENRTMEIILTSSSPTQIMTGKVIGNMSVGLTQLLIWILFGLIGFIFLQSNIPEISNTQFDWSFFFLMVATFLPAFVMISALMATLGATATETKEAQQIAGLFSLPIAIPFWFVAVFIESPNSPLAIIFSIFPFTAPLSLPLTSAFTNIPILQTISSVGLLVLFAIGAIWLAGRAFRLGMLRYGKKLSLKELFRKA